MWVVLGVVLVVAEAFTATFVLIMLAAGAFAAAAVAALGLPVALQAVAFAVVSAVSLWLLRPVIRRHFLPTVADPDTMDGVRALEGAAGEVLERVTGTSGVVKVEGELWSARAYDAGRALEPGERIRVGEIRGTIMMVVRDEFGDIDREASG
jgi:membrane protein implicated in regulation of membrane protease activity